MSVVYDAGVLIAADRNDRAVWADHQARLELGLVPVTTAPVVAQVSRRPQQAQLRRFLRGCDVQPLLADEAHAVGLLLGRAGTADVVDGHLAIAAARTGFSVRSADEEDLELLSEHLPTPITVLPIHAS